MTHDSKYQRKGSLALQLDAHGRPYNEQADMLRVEVLYEFGGIAIDADFECIRPLDPLLEFGMEFDYVSAWEHDRDPGNPLVAAGVQMAHARSPSVLRALARVGRLARLRSERGWVATGPCWTSLMIVHSNFCNESWKQQVLAFCGSPWQEGPDIPCASERLPMKILPSDLFYPNHWTDIASGHLRPIPKEAYMTQHWSSTWGPDGDARRRRSWWRGWLWHVEERRGDGRANHTYNAGV